MLIYPNEITFFFCEVMKLYLGLMKSFAMISSLLQLLLQEKNELALAAPSTDSERLGGEPCLITCL